MTVQVRNEDFSMLGEVHIKEGEIHPQDLVVIGGTARVEGEVLGDIVVILGELYLSGHANRGVVAVLSEVTLDDGAVIDAHHAHCLTDDEGQPLRIVHRDISARMHRSLSSGVTVDVRSTSGVISGFCANSRRSRELLPSIMRRRHSSS